MFDGLPFPMVLAPKSPMCGEQLCGWAASNRAQLAQQLKTSGAVLFRGFPVHGAVDFQGFVDALGIVSLPYVGKSK